MKKEKKKRRLENAGGGRGLLTPFILDFKTASREVKLLAIFTALVAILLVFHAVFPQICP